MTNATPACIAGVAFRSDEGDPILQWFQWDPDRSRLAGLHWFKSALHIKSAIPVEISVLRLSAAWPLAYR